MELKPCPCGKVPERLSIMDGSTYRWRYVGCPCDEWWIEANVRYADRNDAEEIYSKCVDAWNRAPRRASGWIPVGERLPEYDVPVLVVSAFDDYTVAMKWEGLGDDDWRFVDCRELMTLIGITHWQPLPEPPV